jgi:hypothetical protein
MKTYTGGCHCGKVRFEANVDLDQPVTSCNCSICSKKATLLSFVKEDAFKLLSGEDELTEYLFNKRHIHHTFCKVCGIEAFASGAMPDGTKMRAINVRCLDDVDLTRLSVKTVDGKSF